MIIASWLFILALVAPPLALVASAIWAAVTKEAPRTTLRIVLVAAGLLLAPAAVRAHHSMVAQFSVNKPPITLRGTITKMMWLNPHGQLYVDVKGEDGLVENWVVETGAPLRMVRLGLKRTSFQPGLEVIVGGYAARDGQRMVAGMVVTFLDGLGPDGETSFSLGR